MWHFHVAIEENAHDELLPLQPFYPLSHDEPEK